MPEISIIVPVYNTEKYFHRCVDSILTQTFWDFELILVDDGSPDNCPAICDAYAAQDSRIHVIHQANGGQAAARNAGINIAQGEWILFCDSDDCYNSERLCFLLQSAKEKEPKTLFCFNYYDSWPDGIQVTRKYPKTNHVLSDPITFLSSNLSHRTMGFAIWNKLYSKSILNQYRIRFFERDAMNNRDDWAEDLTFNLQYCMCVDGISVSEEPVYLLTKHGMPCDQNENSLIGRLDHMLRIFLALRETDAYQQYPEQQEQYWKIVIWHMRRYLYLEAGNKGVAALRQQCMDSPYREQLFDWINQALSHWKQINDRWDDINSSDYRLLLRYIRDGNMLAYKAGNYWLWRIKPIWQKLMWRKP